MRISMLVWMLLLLLKSVRTLPLENGCGKDSDCGTDFYCNGGICERCFPCTKMLNRHPSSQFRNCARNEEDCGSCLPGFDAEELTNQRYATRCSKSPVSDPGNSSGSAVLPWDLTVILPLSLVLLVATGIFGVAYWRKKRPLPSPAHPVNPTEERDHLMPPPPYTEANLVHVPTAPKMNEINFVHVEDERLNETAPIGPRHWGPFEIRDVEDFQEDPVDINNPTQDSDGDSVTSVETIPSHWEPGSTAEIDPSTQSMASDRGMNLDVPRFARSQSLDLRRTSDPDMQPMDLGSVQSLAEQPKFGIYEGIHISLSNQRITRQQVEESSTDTDPSSSETSRGSSIQNVNEVEPDPPLSFQYLDRQSLTDHVHSDGHNNVTYQSRFLQRSLSASGNTRSDDSGFVDYANSRRRRAVDQLEIGFTLHIKQPRK